MNIRVLREAGGVGDVVRILPAVRGLREAYPDARIDVFVPGYYQGIVRRGGDASNIFDAPCGEGKRRARLAEPNEERWPYMKSDVQYDRTVDLYCPAFAHEMKNGRNMWNDRIELFCMAAGVRPESYTPQMEITGAEKDAARALLKQHGIAERKGWIALQPFSTDGGRDWPRDNWQALAEGLALAGYGVFALDSCKRPRDFPCPAIMGKPLMQVAAILSIVRVLIGPDSGLLHLCGAAGGAGIGLTASQPGGVLYRHYPRHTYIHPDDTAACHWPCFWRRGQRCARKEYAKRGDTCYALTKLTPGVILDAVLDYMKQGGADACRLPLLPPLRPSGNVDGPPLPIIPCADRQLPEAEFRQCPDGTGPGEWIWEYFRVLQVGGKLTVKKELLQKTQRLPGFTLQAQTPEELTYRKAATWPDWRLS